MVRLVFRPYAQVWRTICTSVSLRASIKVSRDFTLPRHRSPSFGSRHVGFCLTPHGAAHAYFAAIEYKPGKWNIKIASKVLLSLRNLVCVPKYSPTCQTPWSVFQDGSFVSLLQGYIYMYTYPGLNISL